MVSETMLVAAKFKLIQFEPRDLCLRLQAVVVDGGPGLAPLQQ